MKKANRLLALTLSLFMLLALLAGCGGGSSSPAGGGGESTPAGETGGGGSADEKIRVVTFFAGSDQWVPVWKEVIAEYMAANPGVEIVDESQPTSGENDVFRTKIQGDIAAKDPPDLMLFFVGADGELAIESELFVDFTDIMAADTEWSQHLRPAAMAAAQQDGAQYAIPYIGYYEGLFYNKGLFDEYDLAEPTTWEAMLACIDVFNDNGIVPFAGSMGKPAYILETFILSAVGAQGQQNYFDDSWALALNSVAELYKKGAFPADTLTLTDDDVRLLMSDEKAAMMVNGSWCVGGLADNPEMRMIAVPTLPGGKGGENTTVAGYGSGWYMSKAAAERSDATLDFLKFMTSPETMTRFIEIGGSPAIDCEVPESATPLEISALEMLAKATETRPAADSQVLREAWLSIGEDGMGFLCEGQVTAEDLLEEARRINDQ